MTRDVKAKKLPFVVSRNSRLSLIAQIADGFRRAIADGRYRSGEVLPTLREISEAAGVSMMVARGALKRLVADGLVNPRQGVGSVVLGRQTKLWRGRVLLVSTERHDNFAIGMVMGVVREMMIVNGYVPGQVAVVCNDNGRPDFTLLDLLLRESMSLVVLFGDRWGLKEHLRKAGVPLVVFGAGGTGQVKFNRHAAMDDFVAHCHAVGATRILVPLFEYGSNVAPAMLKKAGMDVETWHVRSAEGYSCAECVQRGAFEAFRDRLASGRSWLPDVIYFDDEYAAAGGLMALDLAQVRIPEDVGVVTWCARGNGPVYQKSITCLENDPVHDGYVLADYLLAFLRGHKMPPEAEVRSIYVAGETFPRTSASQRKGSHVRT